MTGIRAGISWFLMWFLISTCLFWVSPATGSAQDSDSFTPDQLDNLLAPVALYPDPLLADVLLAATFPDQIDEAARFIRGGADPGSIDVQPWNVSVKAIAHYPQVLFMMADKLDWTAALSQAYVNQPTDVIAAIQRLRQEAYAVGNLTTTPEEQVADTGDNIEIWPADAQYIYVPVYDSALIYFGRGLGSGIRFGSKVPIGAWLCFDFDWAHRRVYYHGWTGSTGWIVRSRPYIHINAAYVNASLGDFHPNRTVLTRTLNDASLNRYNAVHRDVTFGKAPLAAHAAPNPQPVENRPVNNKILERNVDSGDSRINDFRGREEPSSAINPSTPNRPESTRAAPNAPPPNRVEPSRAEPNRIEPNRVEANRPGPQPVARPIERPAEPAFEGNRSAFNPSAASERVQASRAEMAKPEPPRPAPEPRPEPARQPEPARPAPESKPSSPPSGRGGKS